MPTITLRKTARVIPVELGANLMRALLAAGIPVASSCNGDGICAKCRVTVSHGSRNLSPETESEKKLRETHHIPAPERLACQTTVLGDVVVDTSYW